MKKRFFLLGGLILSFIVSLNKGYTHFTENQEKTVKLPIPINIEQLEKLITQEHPSSFFNRSATSDQTSNEITEIIFENNGNRGGASLNLSLPPHERIQELKTKLINNKKELLEVMKRNNADEKLIQSIGKPTDPIKIRELKFRGEKKDLENNLKKYTNIDSEKLNYIHNPYPLNNKKKQNTNGYSTLFRAISSFPSRAPIGGSTEVNQTIAYNSFRFNNTNDFKGNKTYEHETQIYNTNYADYNDYRESNLPEAYLDTPFLDDIDNFTIGSADASRIEENTDYYTHMKLKAGTESTAKILIKGQIGHRVPEFCYSTWCIFADATTPKLISGKNAIYGISRTR